MTPLELRADIPALENATYFNTGASGPSPRYAVEVAQSTLATHGYESHAVGDPHSMAFDADEDVRRTVADFIGANDNEVALTESTTDGINRFATALEWEPGDVVVRTDLEHPAGIRPWQRLERHGVEVRVVESEAGRIDREAFAEAAADARLVCLSSVTWTRGTRLPVVELTEIAHDQDTLVLVDAVQTVGQLPVDVHKWGADAVAAAGHKWLLGTWGGGFLYARESLAERLEPAMIGYRSVSEAAALDYEYEPGAKRFEVGTTNPAAHVALRAAIRVVEEVGLSSITSRVKRLSDRLRVDIPYHRLLSPSKYKTGLVAIEVDDAEAVVERLAAQSIVVRALPAEDGIRVSIHAFNTGEEVDRLLTELQE